MGAVVTCPFSILGMYLIVVARGGPVERYVLLIAIVIAIWTLQFKIIRKAIWHWRHEEPSKVVVAKRDYLDWDLF